MQREIPVVMTQAVFLIDTSLTTQHHPMLKRNLIYTGVTRGKRLVMLVGQQKALASAVKGARARRRWSKLREWLMV
jgi:exodeoxyribonuclease V alpha subunit